METANKAAHDLLELIKQLNIDYAFERSFKVTEKILLGDRILYGIYTEKIKETQHKDLLAICQRINMPEEFFRIFRDSWHDSNALGWAFEIMGDALVYKTYLEFWDKWKRDIKDTPKGGDPFVVLLGFKWVASDQAKRSLASYTLHPFLTFEGMLERLSTTYQNDRHRAFFEIAKDFLRVVSSKVAPDQVRYIEVAEENTPRKSFDINVYNAHLELKEVYPLLQKIYQHFSISPKDFHGLYNQIRTKTIGHLSGGISRDAKEFFTIYYGLEEVPKGQ